MSLFARHTPLDSTDPAAQLEAYREGQKDERQQNETGGLSHRGVRKELNESFDRGREHGHRERQGSAFGVLLFLVLIAVVVGGAVMAVNYSSFGAAGAAIDQWVASI